MTDRRSFVGGVAGAVLASPGVTLVQQTAQGARIGFLGSSKGGLTWDAFRRDLRELGCVEGRNLTIESRWAQGNTERFAAFAKELVILKGDLIVTVSTPAALAAKQATSSIPIVMAVCAYPERLGLVDSLAHPGGNVTGFSNIAPELAGKHIQLVKEMVPKVSRLAELWNPTNPLEVISLRGVLVAASALGVQVQSIEGRSADDHPRPLPR